VNGFAKGAAGVRPELAEGIVAALNDGVVPLVHSLGSVGVSDLGPMAELAEGLLEHGYFELAENEGLALVNNNAFSTGWAALGVRAAERFLEEAEAAAALDLEAFGANLNMVHPVVGEMRPYPGLVKSIARQRCLLTGSSLFQPGIPRHLQDPLTFRGIPQINGAARDALSYVRHIVEIELNSAQGNPAVVVAERRIVSIANFEVAALAAALDFARICLAPVVGSAAERSVKLLQGPHSGLPAGLAPEADTGEDALAEYAGACQSIAAEARTLARPVSYELVSTTKADGIEDRTTMAPLAARLLDEMVELSSRVVAIELLVAAQAVDLRRPERLGEGTARVHAALRELLPFLGPGDVLAADIEPLVEAVRAGHFFGVAQARAQ
ncbi:MAG: aromatic amino acid lyase, partial [Acidimicrobiales bacterium]